MSGQRCQSDGAAVIGEEALRYGLQQRERVGKPVELGLVEQRDCGDVLPEDAEEGGLVRVRIRVRVGAGVRVGARVGVGVGVSCCLPWRA